MVISSRANARVAFLVHDSLRDGEEMHKTDGDHIRNQNTSMIAFGG